LESGPALALRRQDFPMSASPSKPGLSRAILIAWLIVGTLDISAAMIQTALNGGTQAGLFRIIAAGAFGRDVIKTGGTDMILWGLFFHYVIAFAITLTFFLLYPRIPLLAKSRIATGIFCGVVSWAVTTQIIVRFSALGARAIDLKAASIAAGILIVAIGLPLAFLADRFYAGKGSAARAS
jgi:hypothetical protein